MLRTRPYVRPLTTHDLADFRRVVDTDARANVFLRHRGDVTRLDPRWVGGQVLGWFAEGRLVSVCHCGANIVPGQAGPEAVEAFADHLSRTSMRPSSIAGPQDAVLDLWQRLERRWGTAREVREEQPYLVIDADSPLTPDPRVRRVLMDEIDVLYPASVRMFTEEVGVDPESTHGQMYRARVAQLITQGWAFAVVEDGRIVFKAEVGAVSESACQIQGVWVEPTLRGRGLAAPAMAAVVQEVRASIAPVVTLYVNAHNQPARRTYERVGFTQHETFATVLL